MASESSQKSGNTAKAAKQKGLTQEQIISGFNQLRQEQRALVAKAAELEMELNEHNLVIETLKQVDGERKCYRMIGGVLVERRAKDILPALTSNQEQLGKFITTLNQQIAAKGQEINEFREKHNIRFRGQEENVAKSSDSQSKQSQGVLVENKS
ncbi:Prefoldin subunit 2 [Chamberlinius hualienensis]